MAAEARWERLRWPVSLAIVAASFAWTRWAMGGLGFAGDDLINLAQADESLPWRLQLFRPVFGHLSPCHRLIHLALARGDGPPAWSEAASLLAAIGALQVLGLAGALTAFRVEARFTALLTAWFAFAPTRGDSLHWLATSAHVDTHLALVLLGLWAALEGGRRRMPALLWAALSAWVLALGTYEKALLTVPAAVLLAEWESPSRRRWFLATGFLLTAGFAVAIVSRSAAATHVPQVSTLVGAYGRAAVGPLSAALAPVGGLALLALAAVASIWSAPSRARAAIVLGGGALMAVALLLPVALGRLPEMGTAMGDLPRYTTEWLPVLLLSLGLAARQAASLKAALAVAALAVAATPWRAQALFEALRWEPGLRARSFADRVDQAARERPGAPLLEGEVTSDVLEGFYWPWTRAQVVLSTLRPGSVRPLIAGETAGFEWTAQGLEARVLAPLQPLEWSVAANGCEQVERDGRWCFSAGAAECFPVLTAPALPDGLYSVDVETPAPLCVGLHAGGGVLTAGWPRCVPVPSGRHWFRVRPSLIFETLDFPVAAGSAVCVSKLQAWEISSPK